MTRPTGRAVRSAVEQQLTEVGGSGPCISILDFTQVRVMDYSCADEIVAKLLLRYSAPDRPIDAYFLARGLRPEHLECIHAVLDRHDLLLAAVEEDMGAELLGPATEFERRFWERLVRMGRARVSELAADTRSSSTILAAVDRLLSRRVLLAVGSDLVCPVARLPG